MHARSHVDSLRACPISCSHDGLSADPRQILHGLKAVQDDASTKQGFSSDANPPRGVILNPASAGEGSGVRRAAVWTACELARFLALTMTSPLTHARSFTA